MQGYGYSLWLVPILSKQIQHMYSMKHIPHITVCTNLQYIDSSILSQETFIVDSFSQMCNFPKMYNQDPLNACGFYCNIENIKTNHKPHMTVMYMHTMNIQYTPPEKLDCRLYFADTRSLNCSDWKLV